MPIKKLILTKISFTTHKNCSYPGLGQLRFFKDR